MNVRSMLAVPLLALLLVAVLARPASAGGWATVELSSTPDGVRAGEEWVVDLKILQHGRTPLENVDPSVTVFQRDSGRSDRFVARATEQPGVYRAAVSFPAAGEWEYRVDDGFGAVQTYPVVTIAEPAAPSVQAAQDPSPAADDGIGTVAMAGAVVLGLLAAGVAFAVLRRRGLRHASTGAPATPARS
jgi:hypothetical protein